VAKLLKEKIKNKECVHIIRSYKKRHILDGAREKLTQGDSIEKDPIRIS